MLTVEQITIFVLFEDILTAVVMAWTVIVGGDVYEDIVTAEEREKFNTLFVKAIRRDAKEYHRSVESNQRKNGDLQLGFSKIYSQLLREFLKTIHSLKGSDLITTPEARYYSIQELVELGADQISLLKDIKTGLELIGDRLPLLKQPACSTPQVEFSALASENPEDQNSLSSPFIWLPPPSNSVSTKGKQDTPSSDGVDPLWLEVKRQFVNKMHSSDASTLARYDMTSKIDDVHISYAGTLTELSQGTLWEGSKKIQVAFKVFRAMQDPPRRQKFSNLYFWWLQFWVIFNHQNVVPVLGFMLSTNLPYALVLPWYGSGNIFGYLKSQKGAVPFHRRIQLIRDIVEGMNHYHHHRLVHGDLRGVGECYA
ncbi:hypothetical protein FRC03_001277 [Tulasnella sp. 419]|nr:hypothetical protein FRC03_001277 [Tulasnella sp. 419]